MFGTSLDSCDTLLDNLEQTLAALSKFPFPELSSADRKRYIPRIIALDTRAASVRTSLIAASISAYDYRAWGHLTARRAIADIAHIDDVRAARYARLAERLTKLPVTTAAFAAGRISEEHAEAIAGAHDLFELAADPAATEAAFVAAAQHADATNVRRLVRDLRCSLGKTKENGYKLRAVTLSPSTGLWALNGNLDPEMGERLNDILHTIMVNDPNQPGETRTMPQRRHDALTELVRQALTFYKLHPETDADGTEGDSGNEAADREDSAHDEDVEANAETGSDGEADEADEADEDVEPEPNDMPADEPAAANPKLAGRIRRRFRTRLHLTIRPANDDTDHPIATLDNGMRLATAALERLLCDCELARAVIDAKSIVLDLGRSVRTATDAQFRALVIRDRNCVVCHRGPEHCEAHHLDWWENAERRGRRTGADRHPDPENSTNGGPRSKSTERDHQGGLSDLNNLCLLCWRCHHLVHDAGWQIHIDDNRNTHLTRPDGSRAPPIPKAA